MVVSTAWVDYDCLGNIEVAHDDSSHFNVHNIDNLVNRLRNYQVVVDTVATIWLATSDDKAAVDGIKRGICVV